MSYLSKSELAYERKMNEQNDKQLINELTNVGNTLYEFMAKYDIEREKVLAVAMEFHYIAEKLAAIEREKTQLLTELFNK